MTATSKLKGKELVGHRTALSLPSSIQESLLKSMSDPTDLRSDAEIAQELGITEKEIKAIRHDPSFSESVVIAFRRNLNKVTPEVFKALMRRSLQGSVSAGKLLLEAVGSISSSGDKTLIINQSGARQDHISKLNDTDLDAEITRLIMDCNPEDLLYSDGKISPVLDPHFQTPQDTTWEEINSVATSTEVEDDIPEYDEEVGQVPERSEVNGT